MRYLLDTTLLLDHVRGVEAASEQLRQLFAEANELFTCDIVTCEALSSGSQDERYLLERLLDALDYVATDPTAARWAAESRRQGRTPPGARSLADALIGAVAWRMQATIVTRNVRDFSRQGISVLTY